MKYGSGGPLGQAGREMVDSTAFLQTGAKINFDWNLLVVTLRQTCKTNGAVKRWLLCSFERDNTQWALLVAQAPVCVMCLKFTHAFSNRNLIIIRCYEHTFWLSEYTNIHLYVLKYKPRRLDLSYFIMICWSIPFAFDTDFIKKSLLSSDDVCVGAESSS